MSDKSIHYTETVERWTHEGLECKYQRHQTPTMGWYTGYVRTKLPATVGYDDLMKYAGIDAHGGLTYGVDDDGWVGFDCNHAWDICIGEDGEPLTPAEWRHDDPSDRLTKVWGPEGVKNECERLAEQLVDHFEDGGADHDADDLRE